MNLIKPFGPEIGHYKLSEKENNLLLDICQQNKDNFSKRANNRLSGFIDKEFDILDPIQETLMPTFKNIVVGYLNSATSNYENYPKFNLNEVTCLDVWCNIQEPGEFNPLHFHPLHDLVCVAFPKIDIKGKSKYETNSTNPPGSLVFNFGSQVTNFGNQTFSILPETCDVLVFPSDLAHYTIPIWDNNDTRISVSFNFIINDSYFKTRGIRQYKL